MLSHFACFRSYEISELPKCCILRRHSKAAKGDLPSMRESNIGWTAKRSRYSSLTILGVEAFDVPSNNHEEFGKLKEHLGDFEIQISLLNQMILSEDQIYLKILSVTIAVRECSSSMWLLLYGATMRMMMWLELLSYFY